ncbi:MAG: hypothetical protein LUD81_06335 [Clostridiales bacterium]|nr:hypothetical protein [Clostridiales bacterium]
MVYRLNEQTKQTLAGNVLLVVCCLFYLAWWLLAFKPTGAVKGMKSGLLLLPALVFGLAGIAEIIKESNPLKLQTGLIPGSFILLGGIVAYLILYGLTSVVLKRHVTTELFLIVGWAVLMFSELNALYAEGYFSKYTAVVFIIITATAAAVSLICYILYYKLDTTLGYYDGAIPLVLTAAVPAAISVFVII